MFASSAEEAAALTADDVLTKMSSEQRHGYLSGLVDGFAFARWRADKPDESGTQCIFDWFYTQDAAQKKKLYDWFGRHRDKHVDALIFAMIRKECGE